jgi:peroxiredoxin
MHNSRIIISVNPKFMINSQDVPFGITRQCAQVGVKNINIFNMKNHLSRSDRNGKPFLEKDLHYNVVQFLA